MHFAILRSMPYYETESLPPPCHKRLNSSYFYSVNSFCFSLETTCHGTHATLSLSVKLNTISYSESTAMLAQKYHTHGSFSYHQWEYVECLLHSPAQTDTQSFLLGWDGKGNHLNLNPTQQKGLRVILHWPQSNNAGRVRFNYQRVMSKGHQWHVQHQIRLLLLNRKIRQEQYLQIITELRPSRLALHMKTNVNICYLSLPIMSPVSVV